MCTHVSSMIAIVSRARIGPSPDPAAGNPNRLWMRSGDPVIRLEVDSELAKLNDRRAAPADRERECERHSVLFAEWLAVAQDVVVARSRLDGEADRLEPTDELADVFSHPGSFSFTSAAYYRVRSSDTRMAVLRGAARL